MKTERLKAMRQLRQNNLKKEQSESDNYESSSISCVSSDDNSKPDLPASAGLSIKRPNGLASANQTINSKPNSLASARQIINNRLHNSTSAEKPLVANEKLSTSVISDTASHQTVPSPNAIVGSPTTSLVTGECSRTLSASKQSDDIGRQQSTAANSSTTELLTTGQRNDASSKTQQAPLHSSLSGGTQSKPKSRREILRSRIQFGKRLLLELRTHLVSLSIVLTTPRCFINLLVCVK